jgi:hypothetical protein
VNTSLILRQVRKLQGRYRDAAYLFGLGSVSDVRTIVVVKGVDGEGFAVGYDDGMLVGKM